MKRKTIIILIGLIFLLLAKLWLSTFLMAQNGDTYDFFHIAESIKNGGYPADAKRMPLFPFLLSFFPAKSFGTDGHILVNLFYIGSIVLFFQNLKLYVKDTKWIWLGTILFATNMIIVDNSFYIMSDTLFTFLFLAFLLIYNKDKKELNTKSIATLTLIGALAFLTRPEGALLLGILCLTLLLKRRYSQILLITVISFLVLFPVLTNNLNSQSTSFYSGYMSDQAGFNINLKNVYMGLSILLFGMGGTWLLTLVTAHLKKCKTADIWTMEFLIFSSFSILLIFWGPYIRLYSIPIVLALIYAIKTLESSKSKPNKITFSIYTVIGTTLYIIAVQFFNQRDLGMFKFSKATTITFSLAAAATLYPYIVKRKFSYAILFTALVFFINLAVFTERFVNTRYKYYTIVQASEYYAEEVDKNGLLGYSDESGVEKWHLRNWGIAQYDHIENPEVWVEQNNVTYFLITKEMGDNSESEKNLSKYLEDFTVLAEFRSPGYGGYSKLVKIPK